MYIHSGTICIIRYRLDLVQELIYKVHVQYQVPFKFSLNLFLLIFYVCSQTTPLPAPPTGSVPYSLLTVRMVLTGVYYGLAPNSLTLRMCPPITNKNWKSYKYLVAIGNSGGGVQIFDMRSRQLYREMVVHTCPVK